MKYLSSLNKTMVSTSFIPFNKPYINSKALEYLTEAISSGELQGDGSFTKKCEIEINKISGTNNSLLTPSCTDAIEMAYMLIGISPGDEIIIPSFNFTSAAIAAVKLGATPVFVDIDLETLNISQTEVLNSISKKTKAICFLNYAGYGVDLDLIKSNINSQDIYLIEDNAHGFGGKYMNSNLGNLGDISVQSFHSTKNIQCGEGGSISFRDETFLSRSHILRQKGTNRYEFSKGIVSKYTWVDQGSSFLASELQAAVLYSQLQEYSQIQASRENIWKRYFVGIESQYFKLPPDSKNFEHTSHIFYLRLPSHKVREEFINYMLKNNVQVTSHYETLHNSIAGKKYSKSHGSLANSIEISETIVRLPIWIGLTENLQDQIIGLINAFKA